ncbi:MAG: 16S rRNA (guanine(966)-N(2))-methyltransferase RsmD [Nitrosospira sp.]|nr:16S rRNA (guanine(966)-N(2))-methyltransferase RsmD [Nitrosospira sp.]
MRNKVRITGGEWRSRLITFPSGADLRPTPDRVRQTVFNWLGQDVSGKRCLDLFAGSGVMGLEAASRGAEKVVMVESSPPVVRALQASLQKLEAWQVELIAMDASRFLDSNRTRFDAIFLDPPYRLGLLPGFLRILHPHLAYEGLVYIENDHLLEPGADWRVWRKGQAGRVQYQLLKSGING